MQQYSAQLIPDPSDTDQTFDSNLVVSADSSESETDSSLESSISSSDSEKSYADITRILMAQPDETKPAQSLRLTHSLTYPQILRKIHQKQPQPQPGLPKMIINLQMVHGSLLMISLLLNGEIDYLKWLLG